MNVGKIENVYCCVVLTLGRSEFHFEVISGFVKNFHVLFLFLHTIDNSEVLERFVITG